MAGENGFEQNGYRIELSGGEQALHRALCEALFRFWQRWEAVHGRERCENGSGVVE